MKASAIVYSTPQGADKKYAKTISDIDPNATAAQIRAFTQALNALSTNTYVETYKILRINCDTEANNNG